MGYSIFKNHSDDNKERSWNVTAIWRVHSFSYDKSKDFFQIEENEEENDDDNLFSVKEKTKKEIENEEQEFLKFKLESDKKKVSDVLIVMLSERGIVQSR